MWYVADVLGFVGRLRRKIGADVLETSADSWAYVSNTDRVSSSLGVNLSPATLCAVAFVLLVGPVPLGCNFENCVIFNPGFNPFQNFHDRYHSPFLQLVSLTCFLGSLGDHQHCGGCYHHHDDDVEVICCQECRQ